MSIRLRDPLPLFAAGALLYVAAAAVCVTVIKGDALTVMKFLVPLFGLPFVLLGGGPRWRTALYLLLLVPAFHYLAVLAAVSSLDGMGRTRILPPGAIGGLLGATLSFLALIALRIARRRVLGTMIAGIVVLGLLGHFGVQEMDFLSGTRLSGYDLLLSLYLPWQIVFGFFLSRLLRLPERAEPADAPGACPNPNGAP